MTSSYSSSCTDIAKPIPQEYLVTNGYFAPSKSLKTEPKRDRKHELFEQLQALAGVVIEILKEVCLIAVLASFIVSGALVLQRFENKSENSTQLFAPIVYDSPETLICNSLQCKSTDCAKVVKGKLEEIDKNKKFSSTPQTLAESSFFFWTIYTTIGYGIQTPKTWEGRAVTMLFSVLGIPLTIIVLARIGQRFSTMFVRSWLWLRSRTCGYTLVHDEGIPGVFLAEIIANNPSSGLVNLAIEQSEFPMSVALLTLASWIVASAGFFMISEDWDYFTALYFTYISFSTIGLGDIVPQNGNTFAASCFVVLIGLSLLSMCLNLLQIRMEQLAANMIARIRSLPAGDEMSPELDDEETQEGLYNLISGESGGRMLSVMMGKHRRDRLLGEYKHRLNMKDCAIQTESQNSEKECQVLNDNFTLPIRPEYPLKEFRAFPNSLEGSPVHQAAHTDDMRRMLFHLNSVLNDIGKLADRSYPENLNDQQYLQ